MQNSKNEAYMRQDVPGHTAMPVRRMYFAGPPAHRAYLAVLSVLMLQPDVACCDEESDGRNRLAGVKACLSQIETGNCIITAHGEAFSKHSGITTVTHTRTEYAFDYAKGLVRVIHNDHERPINSFSLVIGPNEEIWLRITGTTSGHTIIRQAKTPLKERHQRHIYRIGVLPLMTATTLAVMADQESIEKRQWDNLENRWKVLGGSSSDATHGDYEIAFSLQGQTAAEVRLSIGGPNRKLPTVFRARHINPLSGVWSKDSTTKTTWESVNGVYVPSTIEWESRHAIERKMRYSLEWLNVNMKIAPATFQRAAL
jgi:hypothetical protein